jgi:hypothetical protein
MARQDKTIQHIARQDKTRRDKTRQDKTRQDKTRQDKTRQDNSQGMTGWTRLFPKKIVSEENCFSVSGRKSMDFEISGWTRIIHRYIPKWILKYLWII